MKKYYGYRIRILHWCTDQAVTNALTSTDLTAAQGHILGYLARRDSPPCFRNIEEAFQLSHPAVSGRLSRLEKRGFIEFQPDPQDHRCKRIYILERGHQCSTLMHQAIRDNEEKMV